MLPAGCFRFSLVGRKVAGAIALLVAANNAAMRKESLESIPTDGIISPTSEELNIRDDG